jgi:hypothetical protein
VGHEYQNETSKLYSIIRQYMNIDFFKQKKSFKKKDYFLNINTYWNTFLIVFFIVMIASFAFGFYLFLDINKDFVSIQPDTSAQVEKDRTSRIGKVLEYFSEKEKKSKEVLGSSALIVDPSI